MIDTKILIDAYTRALEKAPYSYPASQKSIDLFAESFLAEMPIDKWEVTVVDGDEFGYIVRVINKNIPFRYLKVHNYSEDPEVDIVNVPTKAELVKLIENITPMMEIEHQRCVPMSRVFRDTFKEINSLLGFEFEYFYDAESEGDEFMAILVNQALGLQYNVVYNNHTFSIYSNKE